MSLQIRIRHVAAGLSLALVALWSAAGDAAVPVTNPAATRESFADFQRRLRLALPDPSRAAPPLRETPLAARSIDSDRYPFDGLIQFSLDERCLGMVAADFDGDGSPDLAIAEADSEISLWHNDGTGHVTRRQGLGLVDPGGPMVADDFDGDGRRDLAALVGSRPGGVMVFRGQPDGTLGSPVFIPAGTRPFDIASGDVDGDGRPDLAVSDAADSTVAVYYGEPGGFSAPRVLGTMAPALGLAIADLDGDGRNDIVVGEYEPFAIGVFRNLGGRGFGTRSDWPAHGPAITLRCADLDGDGRLDVACCTPGASAAVMWNEGGGALSAPDLETAAVSGWSDAMEIADPDRDGRPDVIVGGGLAGDGGSRLLINRGGRRFETLDYRHSATPRPGGDGFMSIGDMDGDGSPDVVLLQSGLHDAFVVVQRHRTGFAYAGIADVELGPSAGIQRIETLPSATGGVDIGVRLPDRGVRLGARGDGTFQNGEPWTPPHDACGPRDLDGDGRGDLLSQRGDTLVIAVCGGDGLALPERLYPGDVLCAIEGGDALRAPDLVVRREPDTLVMLLNDGAGGFARRVTIGAGLTWTGLVAGDLDGDGDTDVALLQDHGNQPQPPVTDSLSVLLQGPDGGFTPTPTRALDGCASCGSARPSYGEALDLNGDGRLDLAVLDAADHGELFLFVNAGGGEFDPPRLYPLAGERPRVFFHDLSGDARPDLVALGEDGFGDTQVQMNLNRGDGTLGPAGTLASRGYPRGDPLFADFDGDGLQDLGVGYADFLTGGAENAVAGVQVFLNATPRVPMPVTFSLVERDVAPDHVTLAWHCSDPALSSAAVERRADGAAWARTGTAFRDALGRLVFRDPAVEPGARYGYRLRDDAGGVVRASAEVEVEIPALAFGIEPPRPNPTTGDVVVRFALTGREPATLALLDLAGRLVRSRTLERPVPGRASLALAAGAPLAPGIYWASLTQGTRHSTARVVVLR